MYALILIACTVVAVAIHFGLIRPVMHASAKNRGVVRRLKLAWPLRRACRRSTPVSRRTIAAQS